MGARPNARLTICCPQCMVDFVRPTAAPERVRAVLVIVRDVLRDQSVHRAYPQRKPIGYFDPSLSDSSGNVGVGCLPEVVLLPRQ